MHDTRNTFLTRAQVIQRYGWGRTKGYRMFASPGFPRPIGGDRYRLDSLIAWEDAQLAQLDQPEAPRHLPTAAEATLPAARRGGRRRVAA